MASHINFIILISFILEPNSLFHINMFLLLLYKLKIDRYKIIDFYMFVSVKQKYIYK